MRDKRDLLITIIGVLFGVVMVLLFSIVFAEKFDLRRPVQPGKTAAGADNPAAGHKPLSSLDGGHTHSAGSSPYGQLAPLSSLPVETQGVAAPVTLVPGLIDGVVTPLAQTVESLSQPIIRNLTDAVSTVEGQVLPVQLEVRPAGPISTPPPVQESAGTNDAAPAPPLGSLLNTVL